MFLDENIYKNPEHNYIIFVGLYLYTSAPIGRMFFFLLWIVLQNFGGKGDLISRCRLVSGM